MASRSPRIPLRFAGQAIPQLGLGTWEVTGEDCVTSVSAALAAGYRHIDTAAVYRNEDMVARGIEKSGVPRQEIFITSKLQPRDHGAGAYDACVASLQRLNTDYLDLYLVHWPGVNGMAPTDAGQKAIRRQTWEALQKLHAEGKARAIGVSNYMPWHLQELCEAPWCTVKPAVNQIELHPLLQQREAVETTKRYGLVVEAYSSLARGAPQLLESGPVKNAASAHRKSSAQVVLRWAVQKGYVVVPKSTKPARIAENAALFDWELTSAEMSAIDALEGDVGTLRTCWDPTTIKV